MSRPPKWTPEQKIRMVHAVLQGEGSIAQIARQNKVSETSLGKWRDAFLEGGATALRTGARAGPSSREEQLEAGLDELKIALGEAHAELRVWRKGGSYFSASRTSR